MNPNIVYLDSDNIDSFRNCQLIFSVWNPFELDQLKTFLNTITKIVIVILIFPNIFSMLVKGVSRPRSFIASCQGQTVCLLMKFMDAQLSFIFCALHLTAQEIWLMHSTAEELKLLVLTRNKSILVCSSFVTTLPFLSSRFPSARLEDGMVCYGWAQSSRETTEQCQQPLSLLRKQWDENIWRCRKNLCGNAS